MPTGPQCRRWVAPMSFDRCPACDSSDHDGWVNPDACPEDWTVYSKFQARRWVQLNTQTARPSHRSGEVAAPDGEIPIRRRSGD